MFSVELGFTAKQTSKNDENVLRKMFYVQTNEAQDTVLYRHTQTNKKGCHKSTY